MIQFDTNTSLKPFNTFGIDVKAKYFVQVDSIPALKELIATEIYQNYTRLILGGGSNMLFTGDFDGIVIKNNIKGIEVIDETGDDVLVKACSGENWHAFVMYCVGNNYGGVENLSLIPGTMGAAPMQNIGAYGVEIKEVVEAVHAIDLSTSEERVLSNHECHFGYRESTFKHEWKEKFFISSVTLRLTKKNHRLNTSYGAIQDTLKQMNVTQPTLQSISDAVVSIRRSKLPDPNVIGNAGSFFKNPSITTAQYESLKKSYPQLPGYISENQLVKVPAGWLIEQCGWKGKKINHAGVHAHQALVLVNYGAAKGDEIFQLAMQVRASVKEKFDITLTPEVNII